LTNVVGAWQRGRREFGVGLKGLGALSEDAEQDTALAARWRELEHEALEVASAMADPEAQRHMLFISQGYRLLAEHAESRETAAQEAYE
jgi:hypothetical protein